MRNLSLAICLLFTLPAAAQTGDKLITLEDIWRNGTFRVRSVPGFNAMRDGRHYTDVSMEGGGQRITVHNLVDGAAGETIFDSKQHSGDFKFGIEDYAFSEDETKLLLFSESQNIYRRSVLNRVYIYDRNTKTIARLDTAKVLHATFSPDGSKVAFVKDNNLYYRDLAAGKTIAVTNDGKLNEVINGNCDWVYEEEFEFTKAFAWSPDGKYLAFYRFDERGVPEFTMTVYDKLYPTPYKYKYPKAGDPNSVVTIFCHNLAGGYNRQMEVSKAGEDVYIPRIKWTTEAGQLCVYKMNRLQNRLELHSANAANGVSTVIYTESNPAYVEINDNLLFLPDGKSFVYNSEKSGRNHLYRYDYKAKKNVELTPGNFDIDELIGVDAEDGLVFYTAAKASPMDRQLFSVDLSGKRTKQITSGAGVHNITPCAGYEYFLDGHSSLNAPAVFSLLDRSGSNVRTLEDNAILKAKMKEYRLGELKLMEVKGDSTSLNAWMITPPDFDKNKRYPVLMYQYSGPGSQQVADRFPVGDFWWHQLLAQKGYIVVCTDGTGTGFRGEAFKKKTYLQLGKYESDDQIAVAKYLGGLPYVDKSRIGIWGWSYGGFMSSTCILKGADVFKMAIAVAPVTNWRYYDNIYTERYMRRPQDNKSGYDDNAPEMMAGKLKGKFLLIHGTGDDNVHVQNSMMLINRLITANKDFDFEAYPNRAHGISGGNTRLHLYRKMTEFVLENL